MTQVLIVEDEESMADPLAFLLRREGFSTQIAANGPDAPGRPAPGPRSPGPRSPGRPAPGRPAPGRPAGSATVVVPKSFPTPSRTAGQSAEQTPVDTTTEPAHRGAP